MKRILLIGAIVAAFSLTVVPFVRGQGAPDRPAGVAAAQWVPLNERLGFVIMPPDTGSVIPGANPNVLLLSPPVAGYFMIKHGTRWSRIVIAEPLRGPGDAG
jgi:hypothetical protein